MLLRLCQLAWLQVIAAVCVALASSVASAAGIRVIKLSFSERVETTTVLFEAPADPSTLYISRADLPKELFTETVSKELPDTTVVAGCVDCIRLSDLGLYEENARDASGKLYLFPKFLSATSIFAKPVSNLTYRSGLGFNLAYALRGLYDEGRDRFVGAVEPTGNLGLGRYGQLVSSGIYAGNAGGFLRNESIYRLHMPDAISTWTFGDSVGRAGPLGSAARFGGAAMFRNFTTQPDFITSPVYTFANATTLPSVVDLYIDGRQQSRRRVQGGPFELRDIQAPSGSTATIVVEDITGRREFFTAQLFGLPAQLRQGLLDYYVGGGFQRTGQDSYAGYFSTLFLRYGLSDLITVGATYEDSNEHRLVSFNLLRSLGPLSLDLNLAGSQQLLGGRIHGYATSFTLTNSGTGRFTPWTFGFSGRDGNNFMRLGETTPARRFYRFFTNRQWSRFSANASVERDDIAYAYALGMGYRLAQAWSVGVEGQYFAASRQYSALASLSWNPGVKPIQRVSTTFSDTLSTQGYGLQLGMLDTERREILDAQYQRLTPKPILQAAGGDEEDRYSLNASKNWRTFNANLRAEDFGTGAQVSTRLLGGYTLDGWQPRSIGFNDAEDGALVVDTVLPDILINLDGYKVRSGADGRIASRSRGFVTKSFSLVPDSVPAGYSIGSYSAGLRVLPGTRAVESLDLRPPGFYLRVPAGTAEPQTVTWNGVELPYSRQGAFINDMRVGLNTLKIGAREYPLNLPVLSGRLPILVLDPETGALNAKD